MPDHPAGIEAGEWAPEFVARVKTDPSVVINVEWMTTWFANAILSGYQAGYKSALRSAVDAMRGDP